jgi:hypothetical protein
MIQRSIAIHVSLQGIGQVLLSPHILCKVSKNLNFVSSFFFQKDNIINFLQQQYEVMICLPYSPDRTQC